MVVGGKAVLQARWHLNFEVDANPKISISIPAAGPRDPRGTTKIIEFEGFGSKMFVACGGLGTPAAG